MKKIDMINMVQKKIDGLFSVLFNFNHQDAGFFITL